MRDLTKKQEKLLKVYALKYYRENHEWLTADNMPIDWYEELKAINDTEILYQNIDRFLDDERENVQNSLTDKERILDF
jgi:hypothetical protein